MKNTTIYEKLRWVVIVWWAMASPFVYAATDCSLVTEIPQVECQALVDLYNCTNGSQWSYTMSSAGWNVTNTPCSWRVAV